MAFVWNVMLSFSDDEWWEDGEDEPRETCEPLERINAWIEHGWLVNLISPTYGDGVGYGMHANLYGGGYKHFDIEGFIEVVQAQEWKDRANLQLWIKGEEEESWTPIKIRRRKARQPKRRDGRG
jgi:hypothetical protein